MPYMIAVSLEMSDEPFFLVSNVRRIIDHLGRFFRLLCALLTIPHISQHFQALV